MENIYYRYNRTMKENGVKAHVAKQRLFVLVLGRHSHSAKLPLLYVERGWK